MFLQLGDRPGTLAQGAGDLHRSWPSFRGWPREARGRRSTEIQGVYRVAIQLAARLRAEGYRVVMTKSSENQRVTNKRRAEIAERGLMPCFCLGSIAMLRAEAVLLFTTLPKLGESVVSKARASPCLTRAPWPPTCSIRPWSRA